MIYFYQYDDSDLFLGFSSELMTHINSQLAKMLRYIEVSQLATDAVFGWFLLSWLVTRHFLFVLVIKSAIFDAPRLIAMDNFQTRTALTTFCILLLALEVSPPSPLFFPQRPNLVSSMTLFQQLMQCIWFWMICRVAWRVVTGKGAADERSDDEE